MHVSCGMMHVAVDWAVHEV